ncbi:fungal-specific transcription factor domain-containing protein [Myxozyma melibiosi]|uniref:Fungal-specific transcription factor domain-containing protein n=1 Tax=Myxozyma melibiosi TaxID=54550 RepID=A0ABR1F1U6_9ASCO
MTSSASTGNGPAPNHLTRIISACSRCRSRKTKCDQKFPSCSACLKAGVECVGLDAATGREVPRSYIAHLEDRVAFLEIQLQNQGIPIDPSESTSNRPNRDPTTNSNDPATAAAVKTESGAAAATTTTERQTPKDVDSLVSTVGLVSMKGSSTLSSPSFLGLSSGISFARLMFAAVKLRGQEIPSAAMSIASSEQPDMTVRQKPVKIQSASLPSKEVAETLLEVFFNQANAQIPIFHRDDFIHSYFEPVYGAYSVQTKLANLNNVRNDSVSSSAAGSPTETRESVKVELPSPSMFDSLKSDAKIQQSATASGASSNGNGTAHSNPHPPFTNGTTHEHHPADSPEMHRSLYFLNLIFAIGVAVHQQQYPALLCESYHAAAMRYIEPVFASPDRLESLQGILLLGLYSIMRPAVPGVWYVLGVALRLCVDLGLHVEGGVKSWSGTNIVPKNGQGSSKESDPFDARTLDLRRRLFWCTYAMDRQVCVYLGRPFGIADNSIKVPFPSDLDDVFITSEGIVKPPEDTPPSYKQVAVHIFQIRRLQSEVQTILYERAELPRRFATLKEWQTNMARRLEEWHNSSPKSAKDMNCNFNLYFLDLNYQQTRLLLHGISPAIPRPSVEAFFIIADASEHVIRAYRQLHREKNINYTWMAVHNLFMAGTSYLYCLYHSKEVRQRTRMDVIDFNTMACIHVLSGMVDKCDAASGCRDTFELLTAAILRLCYNEKAAAGEIVPPPGPIAGEGEGRSGARNATPPVPPPMPPPAKRSKRSRSSTSSQTPASLPQIPSARPDRIELPAPQPQYPQMYPMGPGVSQEYQSATSPSAVSPTSMVPPNLTPTFEPAVPSQASTPQSTSSATESVKNSNQSSGMSPFASFESNTLQWMTEMEPDLDEIFKTAAEIQAVPPMHGNFTHPVAYSGNVSGNTQGGGYAYQFSPGAAAQQQFTNQYFGGSDVVNSPGDSTMSASSTSPSISSGQQRWQRPASFSQQQQQQQQQGQPAPQQHLPSGSSGPTTPNFYSGVPTVDDEYDGQRIYEMMYELPSASIWDQFFAVGNGNANFNVGGGFGGMFAPQVSAGGSTSSQGSPVTMSSTPATGPQAQQPPSSQQAQQQSNPTPPPPPPSMMSHFSQARAAQQQQAQSQRYY